MLCTQQALKITYNFTLKQFLSVQTIGVFILLRFTCTYNMHTIAQITHHIHTHACMHARTHACTRMHAHTACSRLRESARMHDAHIN